MVNQSDRETFPKMQAPGKRIGDKFAATIKRLVNNPWHLCPVSRSEARQRAEILHGNVRYAEEGPRVLVRAWLPKPTAGTLGAYPVLSRLEHEIASLAGGARRTTCEGFWGDSSEVGYHYEVSCLPGYEANIRRLFELAGRALGQEWTHITTSEEVAHHVHTATYEV